MPSIRLGRNPKRVIVQWIGIGTHKHTHIGNQAFLHQIVATGETWIRDFEPELKSQSNEWRATGSPRPKNSWRAQSKVKQMLIFAYDHQRVIWQIRVPCGRNVTGVYYCAFMQKLRRKMHKNWTHLLVAGPLILHDSVHPHIVDVITKKLHNYVWEVLPHAPYSPDMSSSDFDLFPKLKEPMRGWRFSSLEEFSIEGTRAIRHLNKSAVLDGIIMYPKR